MQWSITQKTTKWIFKMETSPHTILINNGMVGILYGYMSFRRDNGVRCLWLWSLPFCVRRRRLSPIRYSQVVGIPHDFTVGSPLFFLPHPYQLMQTATRSLSWYSTGFQWPHTPTSDHLFKSWVLLSISETLKRFKLLQWQTQKMKCLSSYTTARRRIWLVLCLHFWNGFFGFRCGSSLLLGPHSSLCSLLNSWVVPLNGLLHTPWGHCLELQVVSRLCQPYIYIYNREVNNFCTGI